MGRIRKSLSLIASVLAVSALSACEGDDSFSAGGSPTAPTSVAVTSSATIHGTVRSATASIPVDLSSTPIRTVATTAGMTVSIAGTSRATVTDSAGQFTLTGVSPGPVRLRFTGSGVNDVLELRSIVAGETVNIVVAVVGMLVVLQAQGAGSKKDPPGDDDSNDDPADDDEDGDDEDSDDDDSDDAEDNDETDDDDDDDAGDEEEDDR
jgi:hypothetical protein